MATRPETCSGTGWAGECDTLPGRIPAPRYVPRKAAAVLSFVLLAASVAMAQHGSPPSQHPAPVSQVPSIVPDPFAALDMAQPSDTPFLQADTGKIIDSEWCNSWTESGVHSPTVSAKRLAVPGKATSEYQKACGAFKGKKLSDAEQHLRKAIDAYPDYSAAWVVLGQVLESEDKKDQAEAACSKAVDVDPGYVASYLCLSEFAANDSDWAKVAKLSGQALALDPIGNPYALYYAAAAGLHFNQLSQAEMHAQSAVKLDEWNHLPELHLLLAQIYRAAGNVVGETVQLREFLKLAGNSKDAPRARTLLAQVETQPAKGQPEKVSTQTDQPAK